jgi:hypothetical protein
VASASRGDDGRGIASCMYSAGVQSWLSSCPARSSDGLTGGTGLATNDEMPITRCPSGTIIVRQAPLSNYSSRAFCLSLLPSFHVQFQLNDDDLSLLSQTPLRRLASHTSSGPPAEPNRRKPEHLSYTDLHRQPFLPP